MRLTNKFKGGRLLMTPGVQEQVPNEEMWSALGRHFVGDWGDIHPEDRGANEQSLEDGSRLLSVYHTKAGVRFWIVTEAIGDDGKRAATTVLLPEEY